jgi:hypothetical protein
MSALSPEADIVGPGGVCKFLISRAAERAGARQLLNIGFHSFRA